MDSNRILNNKIVTYFVENCLYLIFLWEYN